MNPNPDRNPSWRRALSMGWLAAVSTVLAAGCSGPVPSEGKPPAHPHPVILIVVEGLSASHLESHGGTGLTPNLDALAGESVRFAWAFAQAPDPTASLTSLLSGLYATTHGVLEPGVRLPPEVVTLPEVLAGTGHSTAGFLSEGLAVHHRGIEQGFTEFHAIPNSPDEALDWLRAHAGEDFFLLAAGWSIEDALPPGEVVITEEHLDQRLRLLDAWVGELLKALRELGLADRTTLVLTASNGMELPLQEPPVLTRLDPGWTHVPLLIRLPDAIRARTETRIVELVDLTPTLLELNGAGIPDVVQGASLLPLIRGESKPPYLAFGESCDPGELQYMALGGYYLVRDKENATTALYQLSADLSGLADISGEEQHAHRADVMVRHLDDWEKLVTVASFDPERQSEEPLDEETLDRLRSLGYIQ